MAKRDYYAEIQTVPKGYQFAGRVFENRKEAEAFVRFWHGLPEDWNSSKTPTPLCPHCGADTIEEVLPWDGKAVSGLAAIILILAFKIPGGREFIYLLIAIFLAFLVARSGPMRHRCKACEHRFLDPPVYKDDLPSESVPKRQRSPPTPKADSPQTQAKSSERLQTILLVALLLVIVFGMLSIVTNSDWSSSDHPSELELPDVVPQKTSTGYRTPLHWAVLADDVALARSRLADGAEVNTKDHLGRTPLHDAVSQGNPDLVRLLLDHGAEVNTKDHLGRTPLHEAVINEHPDLVRLILAHGAAVGIKDEFERTPLHWAVTRDDGAALVEPLLAAGAAVEVVDVDGNTPLDLAADPKVIDLLTNASHK